MVQVPVRVRLDQLAAEHANAGPAPSKRQEVVASVLMPEPVFRLPRQPRPRLFPANPRAIPVAARPLKETPATARGFRSAIYAPEIARGGKRQIAGVAAGRSDSVLDPPPPSLHLRGSLPRMFGTSTDRSISGRCRRGVPNPVPTHELATRRPGNAWSWTVSVMFG